MLFVKNVAKILRIRIHRIRGISELKNLSQAYAFILINSDNPVNPDSDHKLVTTVFLAPTQIIGSPKEAVILK